MGGKGSGRNPKSIDSLIKFRAVDKEPLGRLISFRFPVRVQEALLRMDGEQKQAFVRAAVTEKLIVDGLLDA